MSAKRNQSNIVSEVTTWLNDREMRAWRTFILATSRLAAAMETDLAPHDLTMGDYEVLVRLSESDEQQMRMCDLAAVLQLSPSGLTRRLDGLVRANCVARVPSSVDRRVQLAQLTAHGRAVLEAAAPTHVDSVRSRLLDLLEPAQIDQLYEIFQAVNAPLAASPSEASRP